jgi:hypothetical protein
MANTVEWVNPLDNTAVILTKSNDEKIPLSVGDLITYAEPNCEPNVVIIMSFTSRNFEFNPESGPTGMTYLPWLKEEKKWAKPSFSMRGNSFHIICSPVGRNSYGQHIHWSTVNLIPNPETFPSVESI